MISPRDPIFVALLTLVSVGLLKWCARTIIEAIAERKRVKVMPCECGRLVCFQPPLQLPTKADLYAFGGQVVAAMSTAEGVPAPAIVIEDIEPPMIDAELVEAGHFDRPGAGGLVELCGLCNDRPDHPRHFSRSHPEWCSGEWARRAAQRT